ncbi:hypothetical protein [Streptomyces sp. NPDC102264]|uniref:hypothetical protein n=1 Tax=Streptomyces sp. NPDC102264 TaxID=3366149 RepID=UPI003825A172
MTTAREGEPFDEHTGLPASELRAIRQRTTWYDLAHECLDQRWDRTPGNTRRTLADAFATITPALVHPGATYPRPRVLRRALYSWAFNKNARDREPIDEWRKALDAMCRPVLLYGPFHRLSSPTQTADDARAIVESGELWGLTPKWGGNATAQAHRGPIPTNAKPGSLEFYTTVKPKPQGSTPPGYASWEADVEAGVRSFTKDGDDWASIPIIITEAR